MKIKKINELIQYEKDLWKDVNRQYIFNGDLVLDIFTSKYYLAEYVYYDNTIFPLFYNNKAEYHSIAFTINFCYPIECNNTFEYLKKINFNDVKFTKYNYRFFTKMKKSIQYRSNWEKIPELKVLNTNFFKQNSKLNIINAKSNESYVKLCYLNHEEYIWKIKEKKK